MSQYSMWPMWLSIFNSWKSQETLSVTTVLCVNDPASFWERMGENLSKLVFPTSNTTCHKCLVCQWFFWEEMGESFLLQNSLKILCHKYLVQLVPVRWNSITANITPLPIQDIAIYPNILWGPHYIYDIQGVFFFTGSALKSS